MNLKQLHTTLLLTLCAALAACSDQDVLQDPSAGSETDLGKTPIALSVGGVDAQQPLTRAVITDGTDKTLHALPHGSSIYMLMKADDLSAPPQTTLCTRTVGFAQDIQGDDSKSNVSFTASNEGAKFTRYWDDIFARKSAVSIAAVCTPGYGPTAAGASNTDSKAWRIGGNATFNVNQWTPITSMGSTAPNLYWPVAYSVPVTDQSATNFITYQDLCFSNNIGNNTSQGKGDTRLKFIEGDKKFSSGKLIFYHALSKLTFNIKMGQGFSDSEFKFNTGTNIKLSNFYNGGTFNISTGEFEDDLVSTDIEKINQRSLTTDETTAGIKFGLDALVIPGTDMTTSNDAVTFYLNHNEYKLTMAQLYAAFTDAQKSNANYFENGKLKAGVHYVFTFTVSKTQISGLTAQIVPWETVDADNINASNARISLQLEDRGTAVTSDVDFYRTNDTGNSTIRDDYEGYVWSTGYEKGTGSFNGSTWQPTNWYWPDNTTFYHFRAVGDKSTSNPAAPTVSNDAFTLTAGETYKDYTWAAPFKELDSPNPGSNTAKIVYSTTYGFDGTFDGSDANTHQIYHGIGPTTDPIKLIMFHMMSDITIKVKSVTGEAAVQLGDGTNANCTTIKFEKIYKSGTVRLGDGLVTGILEPDESMKGNHSFTTHPAPADGIITWANYGAIPQDLAGTTVTDDVILVITTPDKNEYRVSMKDVKATAVPTSNIANPYTQSDGKYVIDHWYPGFKYTYTFTLSKKKIESITATILDWETVTAEDEVQIK